MKEIITILFGLFMTPFLYAQDAETDIVDYYGEDSEFVYEEERRKPTLNYPHVEERDVFYQKKIWRVIDTREKMNLVFRYPEAPFFSIIMDEIKVGNIKVYSTENDKFTNPICWADIQKMVATQDTVVTFDPETYEEQIQIVTNDLNPDDVKKYRLKEVWYFDSKYSSLKVRIMGIAPIITVLDDQGNFRYEKPLFWIYYPQARYALANHLVFNENNTASPMSWEDWLEMRFFSSYIIKENNVHNRRLQDYLSGVDLLNEGERIKQELFNYEHDLWSY